MISISGKAVVKDGKALDKVYSNGQLVYGRNYILGTSNPVTQTSNGKDGQDLYGNAKFYLPIQNWGNALNNYIISFDWELSSPVQNTMSAKVIFDKSPYQNVIYTVPASTLRGHVSISLNLWGSTVSSNSTGLVFRIMSQMVSGSTITYSKIKMESDTVATDWTPAPEDYI